MKTFLQYIFEGKVVPSPNIHAVPNNKRDDSNSGVDITPEQTPEQKNFMKDQDNNIILNSKKKDYSDPLGIKSKIQGAVDDANREQILQNFKDEMYHNIWLRELPRDEKNRILG